MIEINKYELQDGLKQIIEEQKNITEKLNNSSAYSTKECEIRLELMRKQDINDHILRTLGIQIFEYSREDNIKVKIV